MDILFYGYPDSAAGWLNTLSKYLPEARLRIWQEGDVAAADYAIVRNPPAAMLQPRPLLKAIFNLGAGVDGLLSTMRNAQMAITQAVPIICLDDAGMAAQMTEYLHHAVLHYFRDFDFYDSLQANACWQPLPPRSKEGFPVGIMGMGVLGTHAATTLTAAGFPVRSWSRRPRAVANVTSFSGVEGMSDFLAGLSVLINMLPLTPETENILNRQVFEQLPKGAYVINVARGRHLVEMDLLASIQSGHLAGARLDVCRTEPLPADHPFWREPRISMTPHISASIVMEDSIKQIAGKIQTLEAGQPVSGVVDRLLEY